MDGTRMTRSHLANFHVVVLAAGLGKRLSPLTQLLPKPAVPLLGQPLCVGMITQLLYFGAKKVHVNTSYLAPELEAQISASLRPPHRTQVRFWREAPRLETGGALFNIFQGLRREDTDPSTQDWLIVSGDILGLIPVEILLETWARERVTAEALMGCLPLRQERADVTWVSEDGCTVLGFGGDLRSDREQTIGHTKQGVLRTLFSNFQILKGTTLVDQKPRYGSSINLIYRDLIRKKKRIAALQLDASLFWHNVGTPQEYLDGRNALRLLLDNASAGKTLRACRKLLAERPSSFIPPEAKVMHLTRVINRKADQALDQPFDSRGLTEQASAQTSLTCAVSDQAHQIEKGAPMDGAPHNVKGFVGTFEQAAGKCLIERPASLISACAAAEGLEYPFALALERILALCQAIEPSRSEAGDGLREFRPSVLVTLYIELPTTFPIQLPRPLFIGADLFLELALSQRGPQREASGQGLISGSAGTTESPWLGLLIAHPNQR